MPTPILLITHDGIGEELLKTAAAIQTPAAEARALPVPFSCDPEQTAARARLLCDEMDRGAGVLILTDLYGATPCNVATRLCASGSASGKRRVVSGVNLPMLLRALNYCDLGIEELAAKAAEGGRGGIVAVARHERPA